MTKPISNTELLVGSGYLVVEIDETASPYYYGYMRPDESFIIVQDTLAGSTRSGRFYKGHGKASFITAWAGKGALSYGYPPDVF